MLEWISHLLTMLPRKAGRCSFCQSTKTCIGEGVDSIFELLCGCCPLWEGDDSGLCCNRIGFSDLNRLNGGGVSE